MTNLGGDFMKKALVIILLFSILAVTLTMTLINIEKTKNIINKPSEIYPTKSEETIFITPNPTKKVEPTPKSPLEIYGTYDENDLIIEAKSITVNGLGNYFDIPQISGLKDKKIELQINADIENRAIETVKDALVKYPDEKLHFAYNTYYFGNFANAISIAFEYNFGMCPLNYDLCTGNRIELKDLLTNGMSVSDVLRILLYKHNIIFENSNSYWSFEEEESKTIKYYDETINDWITVPELTDYEIEKIISKILKKGEIPFYYTPSTLFIDFGDFSECLFFKDFKDNFTIYDKYLTKESIFEKDNIGKKGILKYATVPVAPTFYNDNLIFEENYLSIDKSKYDTYNFLTSNVSSEIKQKYCDIVNKKIKDILEEYKEKSTVGDKAYYIHFNPSINIGSTKFYQGELLNALFESLDYTIISCDSKNKYKMYDAIFENYRYKNAPMHYIGGNTSLYDFLLNCSEYSEIYPNEDICEIIYDKNPSIYNLDNNMVYSTLKELFKDGVDYNKVLIDVLKTYRPDYDYENKYSSIENDYDYTIDSNSVNLHSKDKKVSLYIDYDMIKDYLVFTPWNINTINPSNDTSTNYSSIALPMYEYMDYTALTKYSRDELNKLYNEIFARHGHDFRTPSLKDYFSSFSWYTPIASKSVSMEELSKMERKNVELIKKVIDEK